MVTKRSLAIPLKEECDKFLKKIFNISAFTEDDIEKNIIRPILVAVGKAHRVQTQGQYFTEALVEWVRSQEFGIDLDFVVVPDVRYATEYANDELQFFKSLNSFIINVEILVDGKILPPANFDEENNSVIIKAAANEQVVWNKTGLNSSPEMVKVAEDLTDKIINYYGV